MYIASIYPEHNIEMLTGDNNLAFCLIENMGNFICCGLVVNVHRYNRLKETGKLSEEALWSVHREDRH